MSTGAWVAVIAGVVIGVGLLLVLGAWLWEVRGDVDDPGERTLRVTHYVGTILLAAALVCGGFVVAYGLTALDETSPSTTTTTTTTRETESDPRTTVTEEKTVGPATSERTGLLGSLLAFTFGIAAIGGLLVTRDRAPAPPEPVGDDPASLVEAALHAAIAAREAADTAADTRVPDERRRASATFAGSEAIRCGHAVAQSVELDLAKPTAVRAVTAGSDAVSAGRTAMRSARESSAAPADATRLATAVTDAGNAATEAATAAETAAQHLDTMASEDAAVG